MTFEEFKSVCDEKIKNYPEYLSKYKREIVKVKLIYNEGRDLFEEFKIKKPSKRYITPFLLGFTEEVINKPYVLAQVLEGDGSCPDIDSDWSSSGKEKIQNYLKEKYGKDCFAHVGTFMALGPASAASDLMRIYNIDFKESKDFTSVLEKDLSWDDNIKNMQENHTVQYQTYLRYKDILDMVPYFIGKIRQSGSHAGGVVITPKPLWNYIPVDRANGEIITAFPESGSEAVLESLGIVKLDILGISILDVIENTLEMLGDKELYLIEEDGIEKVVDSDYIDREISKF